MRLRKLLGSAPSKNAAASYLAFLSTSAWGLLTIPLAVTYLSPDEIGLWVVVNALLGYLAWFDLGIGPATGRLMAVAIASDDEREMDRWWTATRAALWTLGLLVIAMGVVAVPALQFFLKIPSHLNEDARFIVIGAALVLGFGFPIRGAVGILTAQNRFHWTPVIQAVSPWINLLAFYLFLENGFGIRSYLFGFAASQSFNWIAFRLAVRLGPNRLKWDRSGLSRKRFRQLFSFSGNIALTGIIESFIQTLPNMLLARVSGLGIVPIYNFSSKAPMMTWNLVNQTYYSFYPGLQRLHVTGNKTKFTERHRHVGFLSIGIAAIGAGGVLALNRTAVELLAGPAFYAGPITTIWFAVGVVVIPLAGMFQILLPISGNMGKSPVVALLKAAIGLASSLLLWRTFGLPGLAAAFALLPLVGGIYGYCRGTANCGYRSNELSRSIVYLGGIAIVLVIIAGLTVAGMRPSGPVIEVFGRSAHLPSLSECLPPMALAFLGMILVTVSLRRLLH